MTRIKYIALNFFILASSFSLGQANSSFISEDTVLNGFSKSRQIDTTTNNFGYGKAQYIWHWYESGDTTSGSFNYYFPTINTIVSGVKKNGRMHGAWIIIKPTKKYLSKKMISQFGNAWSTSADDFVIEKYYFFEEDTLLFSINLTRNKNSLELDPCVNPAVKSFINVNVSSTHLHIKKGKLTMFSFLFLYRTKQFLFNVYFKKDQVNSINFSVTP